MSNNLAGIPGTRLHVDVENLFDVYCELQRPLANNNRSASTNNQHLGSISDTFPTNFRDDKTMKMLQLFATIPSDFDDNSVLFYSFVVTSEDYHWRFCFCRSEGKSTMIIYSRLPWHDVFYKMLATLADLKARAPNDVHPFLTNCYKARVPPQGQITAVQIGASQRVFSLEPPSFYKLPSIPDNHNLTVFHDFASPQIMLSLIASLLLERRIIITSRHPDRHSACVQAANALLYPMEWQHTFIPILPAQLTDYLIGPMPYLIGVPISILETTCRGEIGDAIIFNCDAGTYESRYNDIQRLPKRIVTDVETQLRNAHKNVANEEYISYVFLILMVRLMGQYRDGIKFELSTPYFCDFAFLSKRHPSKRQFLHDLLSTSMGVSFINTRLNMIKQDSSTMMHWDRFEMESTLHAQRKKAKICRRSKKKYKPTNEIYVPRNSLQNQIYNALDATESIKGQLERLLKSPCYRGAKMHQDMRDLFEKYRYILTFAASAFNSLQAQCAEEMNNLGYTEISSRMRTTEATANDKRQNMSNANNKFF